MTRTLLSLPLILLSALYSTASSAQTKPDEDERWFQTEIIVFEIREKNTTNSQEIWPNDPGLPGYEDIVELSPVVEHAAEDGVEVEEKNPSSRDLTPVRLPPPATEVVIPDTGTSSDDAASLASGEENTEQPFQLLADDELTLTEAAETLASSSKYIRIMHIAWRQPVSAKEDAQAVYIHSNLGQIALEPPPALIEIDKLMAPPELIERPLLLGVPQEIETEESEAGPLRTIDGTIRLHLGRYLHLEVDLLYRNQTEPMASNTFYMLGEEEQPQTLFRMHQTRRMRSGELHYFDHPMFGVLALITPYELPEPEIAEPEITEEEISVSEEATKHDAATESPPE